MKIPYRVLELWAAQDLTTMGGNSKTESARVVFLVRDAKMESDLSFVYMTRLLNVLYILMKYHENILKGFRVVVRTKFYNFGRKLLNQVD